MEQVMFEVMRNDVTGENPGHSLSEILGQRCSHRYALKEASDLELIGGADRRARTTSNRNRPF